jgi:cobalt/nickel transport protein
MDRKTDKRQKAKGKRNFARPFAYPVLLLVLTFSLSPIAFNAFGAEKWPGVDESVVEKVAREHGREATTPLINTDQGDLLLFVFLLAGVAGGFTAGYFWRMLIEKKNK